MANLSVPNLSVLILLGVVSLHLGDLRAEEVVEAGDAGGTESLGESSGGVLEDRSLGSDAGGKPRPLTGPECKLETVLSPSKRAAEGIYETRVTFSNKGEESIGQVLLVLEAEPMSYWGNSPEGLSVFPEGKVDLYFAGADGDPFLRVGQTKTIPVYSGAGGDPRVEVATCSSEDIFLALVRHIEVVDRFGKYAPYAESSLRSLYLSEGGWNDILDTSGAKVSGEIGRRYFFSTVADSSLAAIAVGVGMMAVGGDAATEGQRGYMAETSFNEAKTAFEEGRSDEAVELLQRVLILEPENAMALNNLAYIMLKRGDSAGAARPFIEQAMKIDPSQPGFQNTLSIVRWGEGKKDEAIDLAHQAYLGSNGEILETKLNLIEWGGKVPDLESWAGRGNLDSKEAETVEEAEEDSVDSIDSSDSGGENLGGEGGVSTSDTIP